MADVGVGFVDILPRSDKFVSALTGQMSGAFKNVQTQLATVAKSFTGVQVAAVGAGLLAAGAIAKGISATTEWASEVRSLQRVTGLAAEDASKLAAAGEDLGIPVSKLNIAFGLLSKNIVNGSANFDKYGIATKDAAGNTLPMLDVLGNISDKFATLTPGAEQTAFAMNVFGRSGKDMIPILQRGSAGLQELYDKAQAAGLVMSQDAVDGAKNLTIAQRQLGDAVKGASISIGESFIPIMTEIVKVLTAGLELFQQIPAPVKGMGAAFIALGAATLVAVKAFNILKIAAAGSGAAMLNFALVAAPIILIMEAIAVHAQAMVDAMSVMNATIKTSVELLAQAPFGQGLQNLVEFAVLFDHAVSAGQQAGLTFQDVAKQTREQLTTAFEHGKLTANEFQQALEYTGVSAEDAGRRLIAAANDSNTLTHHFNDAGKAVTNFAGMTGAALKEWASGVTSSFQSTFTTLGVTVKDTFDKTPREVQKAFDQMLAAAVRFKADVTTVLALKPGTFGLNKTDLQAFEVWLTKQAPDYIDGFVHGTEAQQRKMIADWQGTIGAFNKASRAIDPLHLTADTSAAQSTVQRFIQATEAQRLTITADVRFNAQNMPHGATGGFVSPRGIGFAEGGSTDTIPAMLSPGEFVMRKAAVDRIGLPAMRAMNTGGAVTQIAKPQKIEGAMRISDWRNGLASLDAELVWEDTVRTR